MQHRRFILTLYVSSFIPFCFTALAKRLWWQQQSSNLPPIVGMRGVNRPLTNKSSGTLTVRLVTATALLLAYHGCKQAERPLPLKTQKPLDAAFIGLRASLLNETLIFNLLLQSDDGDISLANMVNICRLTSVETNTPT